MQQFTFIRNTLHLKVKKSSLVVRIIMFSLAFSFFIFPVLGVIAGVLSGSGFYFGYLIGIGVFSLMGFYLLRLSLWNTYGEETIEIFKDHIIYEADYGWFKDAKREIMITSPKYSFKSAGYEEDHEGILLITSEESQIESVVKMPTVMLEELILILEKSKVENY